MKTVVLQKDSIYTGNLILVNPWHPYREENTKKDLVPVNNIEPTVLQSRSAVKLLSECMESLDGWRQISAVSGWRSMKEQEDIYTQSLKNNGTAFTNKFVALPGHSEHQTGLAIDLALKKEHIDFICPDFPYTGICQAFRERAIPFGFTERYPQSKESITGIAHEPWHFRYVGTPHAEIMKKQGFVLEEYIDFLRQYPYGQKQYRYQQKHLNISISYLKAQEMTDTQFEIDSNVPYSVSGNNVDGFIITEWRS